MIEVPPTSIARGIENWPEHHILAFVEGYDEGHRFIRINQYDVITYGDYVLEALLKRGDERIRVAIIPE